MDISVVVPTLNSRERLTACLDALAAEAPNVETVVVNGPSADGTSGMVRDRPDVDVLIELDDRNVNVARNAGLDRATGEVISFLDHGVSVEDGWLDALSEGLLSADVVTGPTHRELRAGMATESPEERTIRGRSVTYFDGGNAAFTRETLLGIDGFDEYLSVGGARDAAHRLAALEFDVDWVPEMSVARRFGTDGGRAKRDWHGRYRSLAYRLVKNYGVRPSVVYRVGRHALADAADALQDVARGEIRPSNWLGNGRDVIAGSGVGTKDGLLARWRDRDPRRNPAGWRARTDRAVAVYDRRENPTLDH